jgi:hypothetical protein
MTQLNVSYEEVEEIFALWSEKYEADPDAFIENEHGDDHEGYGCSCASYFTQLLSEVKVDEYKEIKDAE